MDELLRRAEEPGEGRFTLDPRRAQEQLARHALADPYTYVLKLVQWAVTAGAARMDFLVAGSRLEFRAEGVELAPLGAEAHLCAGRFDLALAIATVARLGAQVSYGEGLVVEGLPQSLRMGELLRVDSSAGWWQRLKTWLRPEAALLRLRCVYCPVPLVLNGELVNRPWAGLVPGRVERTPQGWEARPGAGWEVCSGPGTLELRWRGPLSFEDIHCLGEGPLHRPTVVPFPSSEPGCEAFFQRVPSHEWKYGQSRLTWVRYGVILGIEYGTLPDYIQAVASADAFMVDLSQFALVRGAGEPLVQRLRAACFDA